MKAVLSNRIYLEVAPDYEEYLKNELTYEIPSYADPTNPIIIRNYGTFRKGILTIPIGRVDLIPSNYDIVDKRILSPVNFPEFKFSLRESQQAVYDDIDDNALINAKVSWGKTFTGMAIAGKLGQKTLVVVHTIPLMNQWAKEVTKVYGFEPGIIGGGKENYSAPITIGNVQSLYTRMDKLCKEFGTVILDEMHHVSSPTFSKVMDRSYARYKIGLSGTIERKDGKHVVFRDYFGNKLYQPPRENYMKPKVHVINSGINLPSGGNLTWADRVTILQESSEYRNLISALIDKYVRDQHIVLAVSDRVSMLKHVASATNSALIVGETKDREPEFNKLNTGEAKALCGTQNIFSEGISYDPLSCLILGAPVNNVPLLEQLIGRVVRLCPGKQQPIIVDIRLAGYTGDRQFMTRLGHYMEQEYEIIHI